VTPVGLVQRNSTGPFHLASILGSEVFRLVSPAYQTHHGNRSVVYQPRAERRCLLKEMICADYPDAEFRRIPVGMQTDEPVAA
jgi:hypothetical protein